MFVSILDISETVKLCYTEP